jgi:hypothetical protein
MFSVNARSAAMPAEWFSVSKSWRQNLGNQIFQILLPEFLNLILKTFSVLILSPFAFSESCLIMLKHKNVYPSLNEGELISCLLHQ